MMLKLSLRAGADSVVEHALSKYVKRVNFNLK